MGVGRVLTYPVSDRTVGRLGDRPVPCIGVAKQLEFHHGYEPREADLADLAVLRRLLTEG